MGPEKKRIDVHATTSSKHGFAGFFETVMRRFRVLVHMVLLVPVYGLACICLGIALAPGVITVQWVNGATQHWPFFVREATIGMSLAVGFFEYGFTLLFLLPMVNFLLRVKLKPWRGGYYSIESIGWYLHNGATYLMRLTFLEFFTPTPFSNLFYTMMGMKVGHGTIINTTYISDPSLIELGNHVTVGGSVTIVGHYGQKGYLVLSRVVVGDGAILGLRSTIMAGAKIGAHARVLPESVVLPNTVIPEGETWGGVPARKVEPERKSEAAGDAASGENKKAV